MGRGRKGTGIEIKDGSIRLRFTWRGERCREPLKLKPTAPNLRYAERLAAEIREKIQLGAFDYGAYFPDSPRTRRTAPVAVPTFREVAEKWLTIKEAELQYSTLIPYQGTVRSFWCQQLGDRLISEIRYSDILAALGQRTWRYALGDRRRPATKS